MKKALIGIVIAVAGICCVAGGYYYEMVGHSGEQSSLSVSNVGNSIKKSNLAKNETKSNNALLSKSNSALSNNSSTKNVSSNENNFDTSKEGNSNNIANGSGNEENSNNTGSEINSKENSTKNINKNNTMSNSNQLNENSNNNITNKNSNTQNNGEVKIITPNFNSGFPLSTVIVENGTGKPISNNDLNYVMRQWILQWQYGYNGFCMAYGALWDSQWLDAIPNSELINAFIEVNGTKALSENITANELKKASIAFTIKVNEGPIPFSTAQATKYIQQMLEQQNNYCKKTNPKATTPIITRVVLHAGEKGAGLYYVYTKEMQEKGYKNPYWYVDTNTGYATGV